MISLGNQQKTMLEFPDTFKKLGKGLGQMFYIVSPAETSYEHLENVPKLFYHVSIIILATLD